MHIPQIIKDRPIATIGLVVTIVLGTLSSPFLVNWYTKPELQVLLKYNLALDGRCLPNRVVVRNTGKSAATNVQIYFEVDFFGKRGDIHSYYSGNEPFSQIKQNVEHVEKSGYILIKNFPPGVRQEFIYKEVQMKDDAFSTRSRLLEREDPSVFNFPQVTLVTSDQGQVDIDGDRGNCR